MTARPVSPEEEELHRVSPSRERRSGGSGNRRHEDSEVHRSSRSRGKEYDDRDPSSRPDERRRHHGDEHPRSSHASGRRPREPSSRRHREQGDPRPREESHRRHAEKAHRHHHSATEFHHDGLDLVRLQEPMSPADKMAMISLQTPGMMPPSPVRNPKQNPHKQQQQQPSKPLTKRERKAAMEEAVVEAAFRHFDLDGSGYIDMSELEGLAKQLGQALSREELKALMKDMDTDGKPDGKITLEEFKSWWMREFSYTGALDMLRKNVTRMWLKIRSAAAEPAPVGRAGVGWGGHFGWKALTTAESSLAKGAVKVAVGWSEEASAAGSAQLTGQKMPNQDYSAAMELLQAPGSTVLVLHITLKLRETTTPEDLQQIQTALAAALEQHCNTAAQTLAAAASDLGMDVQGSAGNSPARGAGASIVTLKPRVQPTGTNTDMGPEEHSLDIDIFAGGILLESIVSTMSKAGLSFDDFPSFAALCECSNSLRGLLSAGTQRILGLLALRFDVSYTVRKRLIRKLLGLLEADGALPVALGTLLVSMKTEVELAGLGELLVDTGLAGGSEEPPASPGRQTASAGPEEDDPEWTEVLQGLTGKRLKAWLQRTASELGEALEGPVEDQPLMAALKRFALFIPEASLYAAGVKVELTQPEDTPLLPLDQFFNPDLADIPGDTD